ncbi:unnamed protein product [Nyctereutes procyonoides]|uniref:(raccoon dog) hypothetical protein n=1 Tax=Nyctereutes procyonoides TaxID=34880 RepID=A0A811Z2Z6_NYCPR|nr:unnamed protein product [Nyctereutes procyonoides]
MKIQLFKIFGMQQKQTLQPPPGAPSPPKVPSPQLPTPAPAFPLPWAISTRKGNPIVCPLHSLHPFADASWGDDPLPAGPGDHSHMRTGQRSGRKVLPAVQGIADDYDEKTLVEAIRGEVTQPRGDQCKDACQFLAETALAKEAAGRCMGFKCLWLHGSLSEDFLAMSKISLLSLVTSLKTSQLV